MAYLVRFTVWGVVASIAAATTATGAYWPGYLAGTAVLSFIPGTWMVEIIPDILEAIIESAFD